MNEDHRSQARKHDVWPAREAPVIQPIPEASSVKFAANHQFRSRVLAPNVGHHSGARLCIYNVNHGSSPGRKLKTW